MTPMILVLNEGGIPHRWATWQDVAVLRTKEAVVWEMGDHNWTKFGGISRMTGEQSSINIPSIVAVRGMNMPRRSVPPLTGKNLFRRDLNICGYCGNEFYDSDLTIDHIVPKALNGSHTWNNCVTACKRCNHHKSDKTLEYLGWELLYVPYTPSPEEGLILKNRRILGDQMDFIKKMLPKHSRLHSVETH
jgi:5-methylcytosine-specific restriction endonuclease McrA